MRTKRYLLVLVATMALLVGVSAVVRAGQSDTGAVLQKGRIVAVDTGVTRHFRPADWFRHEQFADSGNIAAETLLTNPGHQMMLVQIRDREKFHYHRQHDLVVLLLEGRGELRLADRSVSVRAGDWLVIPRQVRHQFVNTSKQPARALVLRTPAPEERDYVPASR